MQRLRMKIALFLFLDAVVLILCILHLPPLLQRANAPISTTTVGGETLVTAIVDSANTPELHIGDRLLEWNGHQVASSRHFELLVGFSSRGDTVNVRYLQDNRQHTAIVSLRPYYGLLSFALLCIVATATFGLGVYVLLKKASDQRAMLLHGALVALSTVVIIAWPSFARSSRLGSLSGFLFFASYAVLSGCFFLFSLRFPQPNIVRLRLISIATVLFLTVLTIILTIKFSVAQAPDSFLEYSRWKDVFDYSVLLLLGGGMLSLGHSYIIAHSADHRKKLRWIFFGIAAGALPFLLFTKLPSLVAPAYEVHEHYTLPFLLAIPIAFVISFVRHKALDIDIVIRRTVQYGCVVVVLSFIYAAMVSILSYVVAIAAPLISGFAAVSIAFLFEPVRRKVQTYVDKLFFRSTYDYRTAERDIVEKLKNSMDVSHLAGTLISEVERILKVERLAILMLGDDNRLRLFTHKNFDTLTHARFFDSIGAAAFTKGLPIALPQEVESTARFEIGDGGVFQQAGVSVVVPMFDKRSQLLGLFVLGRKQSEAKYSAEDIDLLNNTVANASLAVERFQLQRTLIAKEAEAEKLKQINQLKSDFLSFVSHDLRTPLTSIRVFAELLHTQHDLRAEQANTYLRNIMGESDRLNRMVSTLLDAQMIESGVKKYRFEILDLCAVVEQVLDIMSYQLEKQGFQVSRNIPAHAVLVNGDRDALLEAFINVISNSMRFSAAVKQIDVSVGKDSTLCWCRIVDKGIGIRKEDIPRIFEKFYRAEGSDHHEIGSGVGLSVVKHIMDAHRGSVKVESEFGKGSSFTLVFPRYEQ